MADFAGRWMQANVLDGSGGWDCDVLRQPADDACGEPGVTGFGSMGGQGQECRRCGGIVESRKQGEQARSTYWCPVCQPWGRGYGTE